MSETESTPETEESQDNDPGNLRKRGDDAIAKASELEKQLAETQRELAFTSAGIPSDGPGAWFRKAYDGDLDVSAIKAAFADGGGGVEQSAPEPDPGEVAGLQAAAQGLSAPPPQPSNDQTARVQKMIELNQSGGSDALLQFLAEEGLIMDPELSADEQIARMPQDMRPI